MSGTLPSIRSKDYPKISLIWKSIPSHQGKQEVYIQGCKEGARAREYKLPCNGFAMPIWLIRSEDSAPGLPISAYDDLSAFALPGGCRAAQAPVLLDPSAFAEGSRLLLN